MKTTLDGEETVNVAPEAPQEQEQGGNTNVQLNAEQEMSTQQRDPIQLSSQEQRGENTNAQLNAEQEMSTQQRDQIQLSSQEQGGTNVESNAEQEMSTQQRDPIQLSSQEQGGVNNAQSIVGTSCNNGPNADDMYLMYELRRAQGSTFDTFGALFQSTHDPDPQYFDPNVGRGFSTSDTQQHQNLNDNYLYEEYFNYGYETHGP